MIFIRIVIAVILYFICGFGVDILAAWYEKKYENIETNRHEVADIALWLLWPFIFLTIIWLVFANWACKLIDKITAKMYVKMDERSNKNGKSSEN